MKKILFILLIFTFFASCQKWMKDEELTIERQPYNGHELRLDGYYYRMLEGDILDTYFFYRNGVLIYGGSSNSNHTDPINNMNHVFLSDAFVHNLRKDAYGVFLVQDDSIVFEKWGLIQGPKPVTRYSGKILNDSTFIITKMESPYSEDTNQIDHLFRFNAFSPKPDSTNIYVP